MWGMKEEQFTGKQSLRNSGNTLTTIDQIVHRNSLIQITEIRQFTKPSIKV